MVLTIFVAIFVIVGLVEFAPDSTATRFVLRVVVFIRSGPQNRGLVPATSAVLLTVCSHSSGNWPDFCKAEGKEDFECR